MMHLTYVTILVLWVPRSIVCSPNQKRHTCEMSCIHQVQLNFIWEIKRRYCQHNSRVCRKIQTRHFGRLMKKYISI